MPCPGGHTGAQNVNQGADAVAMEKGQLQLPWRKHNLFYEVASSIPVRTDP